MYLLFIHLQFCYRNLLSGENILNIVLALGKLDELIFFFLSRFIYEEAFSIDMTNVEKILYAAEKYDVEQLKHKCDEFLTKNIDESSNVLQTLELSQQYQLSNLSKKALECIALQPNKYIESDEFTDLSKDTLKSILSCDDLPLEEIKVYNAALRWAETKCDQQKLSVSDENIRQVLGEILYLIRFPAMGIDTFCKEIVDRNFLISSEKIDIFKQFSNHTTKSSKFQNHQRKYPYTRVFRTSDKRYVNLLWINSPRTESISFSLQEQCSIIGFLTYTDNSKAKYTASLKKNAEIMSSVDGNSKHTNTEDPNIVELHFPEVLGLDAKVVYTIELKFSGKIYGFSENCNQEVEFGNNTVTFSKCQSSMDTNVHRGLIPGLLLSC